MMFSLIIGKTKKKPSFTEENGLRVD